MGGVTPEILVTLDPSSEFCCDLHHESETGHCHSHFDDHGPGALVTCDCAMTWRLGTTLRLLLRPEGAPIPDCTKSTAGEVDYVEESPSYAFEADWRWKESHVQKRDPQATIQMKGSSITCTFTCFCGAEVGFEDQWFLYNAQCHVCRRTYSVVDHIDCTMEPEGQRPGPRAVRWTFDENRRFDLKLSEVAADADAVAKLDAFAKSIDPTASVEALSGGGFWLRARHNDRHIRL